MKVMVALVGLATAVFGFALGTLIGLSHSPVVGVALPLLFSVVGGAGGFYFARVDLASKPGRDSVVIASLAISMLSVFTLVGAWWGMEVRTTGKPWSYITGLPAAELAALTGGETLDWLLLDARLARMGLNEEERRLILTEVGAQTRSVQPQGLASEVAWLHDNLAANMPTDQVEHVEEWQQVLDNLGSIHRAISDSAVPVDPAALAQVAVSLAGAAPLLADDADDQAYIKSLADGGHGMTTIRLRLDNLAGYLANRETPVKQAINKLDLYLSGSSPTVSPARGLASDDPVISIPLG